MRFWKNGFEIWLYLKALCENRFVYIDDCELLLDFKSIA